MKTKKIMILAVVFRGCSQIMLAKIGGTGCSGRGGEDGGWT